MWLEPSPVLIYGGPGRILICCVPLGSPEADQEGRDTAGQGKSNCWVRFRGWR